MSHAEQLTNTAMQSIMVEGIFDTAINSLKEGEPAPFIGAVAGLLPKLLTLDPTANLTFNDDQGGYANQNDGVFFAAFKLSECHDDVYIIEMKLNDPLSDKLLIERATRFKLGLLRAIEMTGL